MTYDRKLHSKHFPVSAAMLALITGFIFMLSSQMAEAATAGRIILAQGTVHALRTDGTARTLTTGSVIYDGDIVNTGNRATTQIRFNDGTLIRLKQHSQFRIDEYQHDAQSNTLTKAVYSLLKGGFRSVTSMITGRNKRAYRVRTAMATIGIRGTDYEANLCTSNCPSGKPGNLELRVHHGAIAVDNEAGEVIMHAGDIGFVSSRNSPMQYLPELIAAAKNNREQVSEDTAPADDIKEVTEEIKDLIGEEVTSPEIVDMPVDFIGGDALQCITF